MELGNRATRWSKSQRSTRSLTGRDANFKLRSPLSESRVRIVSQISPGSYLGQAMNRIEENEELLSDPSDSSSISSSPNSEDSGSILAL
jgi:hypothetical protein